MDQHNHDNEPEIRPHCCGRRDNEETTGDGITRRTFMEGVGGAALGAAALTGLTWPLLAAQGQQQGPAPKRRALVVKPVFAYSTYRRRAGTSWRNWGGIETQAQADQEVAQIKGELEKLKAAADFPVKFLPIAPARSKGDVLAVKDAAGADVLLVYAAGAWGRGVLEEIAKTGKDVIIFVRHKSGPVYLWYEIISPRYLRRHTDELAVKGIDYQDVVVDDQDEILWRLRALCGLRNAIGTRIIAIGGAGGWATRQAPKLAQDIWKLDIQTVSYKELGELIKAARADKAAVERARKRAEAYLKIPKTKLETKKDAVEKCFVLEEIFRALMKKADCRAITVNACMGTVIRVSGATACLPLSTLNDDGYLAFCESDFVAIPAGLLLGNISGRPPFLHNPTYPHDGIITLAHCTAPRKMDGKTLEPARIMTHFESDFGAAPKVDMRKGQEVTIINADFKAERWLGLSAKIVGHEFLPICRSQIDVAFKCDGDLLAEKMRGFHWMLVYGDYLREVGYAMKRLPIEWELLA